MFLFLILCWARREVSTVSLSQMEGRTEHRSGVYCEYVSTGAQALPFR